MSQPSALDSLEKVEFKPGDFLFYENEKSYFFYILQEGSVEVFKTDSKMKNIPLAVIGEGQAVGEFALVAQQTRSASARAITKVVAIKVSEEAYRALLNELPSWAMAVVEGLVERLRQANEVIKNYGIVNPKVLADIANFTSKK